MDAARPAAEEERKLTKGGREEEEVSPVGAEGAEDRLARFSKY